MTEPSIELFPYNRWVDQLDELAGRYQEGDPFPHLALDDFHDEEVLRKVLEEFPDPDEKAWVQYRHFNEKKTGLSKRSQFPEAIGKVIDDLNSPRFVEFLSRLTGIPGLMPDPGLEGGGMHQSGRGGFLNMHADFTMHHKRKNWRRRCNLILYLNQDWQEEWGGGLGLWDKEMKEMRAKIMPIFNRAVIFSTTDTSYHGHPDPMTCPPDRYRRSLALYYYTNGRPASETVDSHSTVFRRRPGDPFTAAHLQEGIKRFIPPIFLDIWRGLRGG